jgi:DNA-binding SARP family transcriptional activator
MPLFRILGSPEIVEGDTATPVEGAMLSRCVAALLLDTNRLVSHNSMLEFLWDEPPTSARQNLRNYVTQLRRTLDEVSPGLSTRITTRRASMAGGGGYRLTVGRDEVDLQLFHCFVAEAHDKRRLGDLAGAATLLGQAVRLWRGVPDQALTETRASSARFVFLREKYLCALEEHLELRTCLGEIYESLNDLRRSAAENPERERFVELLMRNLSRLGDVPGALAAFDRHRRALDELFGIGCSPRLRELHRHLLRQDDAVRCPDSPALATR